MSDQEYDPQALLASPEPGPAYNEWWQARRNANKAIQQLMENFVHSVDSSEELNTFAEQVNLLASNLKTNPDTMSFSALAQSGDHGSAEFLGHEINPIMGQSNPLAPPLNVWTEGDLFKGIVNFPRQYEGPPNYVHGGYIAATFDQLLGAAQTLLESPGVTGTLSVRYAAPAPLYQDITAVAQVDRREGRKIFMSAQMHCNDVLIASSEAIFIRWKDDTFLDLDK